MASADDVSDDEDLRLAIALSLQETPKTSGINTAHDKRYTADRTVICIDDDDEDVAIPTTNLPTPLVPVIQPANAAAHSAKTGLAALNRRAMEAERLARLERKRKAEDASSNQDGRARGDAMGMDKRLAVSREAQGLSGNNSHSAIHVRASSPKRSQRVSVFPDKSTSTSKITSPLMSPSSKESPSIPLQFPHGTVLPTWSFGFPRASPPRDIKIEEVLRRRDLQLAVLSSFQWDIDWLASKLDVGRTKLVLVMQAANTAERERCTEDAASSGWPNLRLVFPPMLGQVRCMHAKVMLLGYGTSLRIVVPTANLTPADWGESGILENSVFLIDLPRRKGGGANTEAEMGLFGRELVYFCRALGLDENIVHSLYEFDFSSADDLAFVHSVGGEHVRDYDNEDSGREEESIKNTANSEYRGSSDSSPPTWRRSGYCGLGRAVRALNLHTTDALELDFITSSVGSLSEDFLLALYLACQGDDGSIELNWRTNAANIVRHSRDKTSGRVKVRSKPPEPDPECRRSKLIKELSSAPYLLNQQHDSRYGLHNHGDHQRHQQKQELRQSGVFNVANGTSSSQFRIFFPSRQTVQSSRGGANAAGVICFNRRWFDKPAFPRWTLRDCKSTRPGLLMHNKIIYVRRASTSGYGENDDADGKNNAGRTRFPGQAWAYVGSANCSESAWGKFGFSKTTKQSKLVCRNWECGVIVPVPRREAIGCTIGSTAGENTMDKGKRKGGIVTGGLDIFSGNVPVPIEWPGESLENKEPWFFEEIDR